MKKLVTLILRKIKVLGFITNTSVLKLFLGGVFPGLLVGIALLLVSYLYAKRRGYPCESKTPLAQILTHLKATIWALLLPIVVMGGIIGGVFTVTEASVVAVVYAFLVAKFIYHELSWTQFYHCFVRAAITSAVVMFIVSTASGVAWILNSERVPQMLANSLIALTDNPLVYMLIVNIFLLIVGSVMDLTPALLILGPILFPIAIQFGLNPIYFGVVMVTNLAIGLVTPPVGSCLYICTGIAEESVTKVIRASFPFLLAEIAVLFLITYIPPIITWLPSLF